MYRTRSSSPHLGIRESCAGRRDKPDLLYQVHLESLHNSHKGTAAKGEQQVSSAFAANGNMKRSYCSLMCSRSAAKCFRRNKIWRKRVGVELKLETPNSRRMMTLQLPPGSNWSQLESERFTFLRNSASSTEDCFLAFSWACFSDCGIADLCRRLAAQVSPAFEPGFDSHHPL